MKHDNFPQLEKTFFIITYGRSGSTLLQNMINSLSDHVLWGENANILAPIVKSWSELRRSDRSAAMRSVNTFPSNSSQPWFGYECIDPDNFGHDLANVILRNVLRPQASTRVTGFKEIRWHTEADLFVPMLEFLQKYMPAAHFIFNTRDHAEVARSGWWKTMKQDVVFAELKRAEELYASWQEAHPECSFAMHYNDYISGPEAWRQFFKFLDMPFDPKAVQAVLDRKLTHMKRKNPKS